MGNKVKKKLKKELDLLWKEKSLEKHGKICFCGVEASTFHHYVPRSRSLALRWDLENSVPLCHRHHYLVHFSHEPEVIRDICDRIRQLRGKKWIDYIEGMRGVTGKDTIWWLQLQKEKL